MKKICLIVFLFVLVVVSENCYSQWIECTNGLPEQGGNKASAYGLISKDSIIYAAINYYGGCSANGIYISSDNGASWEDRKNYGLNKGTPLQAIIIDGSNMFTGGLFTGVFLSTDTGKSWNARNNGLKNNIVLSFTNHNNEIYVGLDSGVYSSSDNGNNWEYKGLGRFRIYSLLSLENSIFAGVKGGPIYKSSDSGKNWNNSGLSGIDVRCLYSRNNEIFAGTWGRGIYCSSDFGVNWKCILPSKKVISLSIIGKNIFAGAFEDGMYLSVDNGVTWKTINNGMNNNYIVSLLIKGDSIFAGTQDGLFRAKITDFGTSSINDENSNNKQSLNISPNPASNYIEISVPNVILSEAKDLCLKIFNILGTEVLNNSQFSIVNSQLKIDVSNLSPGVYIVRVGDLVRKFVKI